MRGASVRGALAPGAAAALCFAALFLSAGSSQSRLFWIGTAAVLIAMWLARRFRIAGGLLLYAALVVVVLTYSRVGIALAVLVALVYLFLDERRLESIGVLAVAWIVGACVAGGALLLPGVSDDGQSYSVRVHDGLLFGLALVVGAAVVAAVLRYVVTRAVNATVVRVVAVVLAALV